MSWQRSRETKRRYKNLYKETKYKYACGCWYDEDKGRLVKTQISNKGRTGHVAWTKNRCNRKVRRYQGSLGSKGTYRKIAELWWELF